MRHYNPIVKDSHCGKVIAYNVSESAILNIFQEDIFDSDFQFSPGFCFSSIFNQPAIGENDKAASTVLVAVRHIFTPRIFFSCSVGPQIDIKYFGSSASVPLPTQNTSDDFRCISVCVDRNLQLSVYLNCKRVEFSATMQQKFEYPTTPSSVVTLVGALRAPFNVRLHIIPICYQINY